MLRCLVETCDYETNTRKRLKQHLALKHSVELDGVTPCAVFSCETCNAYTSTNKYLFEAHVKQHTGEKPYK